MEYWGSASKLASLAGAGDMGLIMNQLAAKQDPRKHIRKKPAGEQLYYAIGSFLGEPLDDL